MNDANRADWRDEAAARTTTRMAAGERTAPLAGVIARYDFVLIGGGAGSN
jgi:hypothetical protein